MMNSNPIKVNLSYKDILLRKLSYSVTCSVISQLFLLHIYIFLTNYNILHPWDWIITSLKTSASLSTWLHTIPFLSIIFAQAIICSKDYVVKSNFCTTRFQKLLSVFSLRNLVLVLMHIIIGGTLVFIFLSLGYGDYRNITEKCKGQLYCLNEGSFYLILSGFWTGFYYFIKVYMSKKHLTFPVINQRKFLQFKANFRYLFMESASLAVWPSMLYIILYYVQGKHISTTFSNLFGLLQVNDESSSNISLIAYLYLFTTLYYLNMNMMRFFFNLFLTEPVEFPLDKDNISNITLQDSIVNNSWPIVQNLACLDLYLLSQWSKSRRQSLFTLSQPGGHPHNWNSLIENVTKLLNGYSELLNYKSDGNITEQKTETFANQTNLMANNFNKFRNIRNMSVQESHDYNVVTVTKKYPLIENEFTKHFVNTVQGKLKYYWNFIKIITGINFLFGELPQTNIQKCLADGQLVIWASQSIGDITCASLEEDPYGIVQKDMPLIITTLVNLKQSLDKLNKLSALSRKALAGYDEFNYRMKGAVTASVRRSIFNVCLVFRNYLDEIPLSKDVKQYLHTNVGYKT